MRLERMDAILQVEDLKKYFPVKAGIFKKTVGTVHAVDNISFYISKGETFGLVGESGCGKTTTALTIMRLIEPTTGRVYFEGKNVFDLKGRELRKLRRIMNIIFQDPFASLNPRMSVYQIVSEPFDIHGHASGGEKKRRVMELIKRVGLSPHHISRYPHEFSGGQRQRIGIARALAVEPTFIIADEPVSALDISVRAQILNLLENLKKEFGLTYLYISHDLSTVKHMCDRVAVMYVGKIVEVTATKELFKNPLHPYTEALLSAIPIPDPLIARKRIILKGDVPTPINPPTGCRFHPRCPYMTPTCKEVEPELINVGSSIEHYVACHPAHFSDT